MKVRDVRLASGELLGLGGGILLAISLVALPWFAITADGFVQPGRDGTAFQLLGGLDVVLLQVAFVPIVVAGLRLGGVGDSARGRSVAATVVAGAGLVGMLVTLYLIVAPPEPDILLPGAIEGNAILGLTARAGAFVGLLAAAGILAGGVIGAELYEPGQRAKPRPVAASEAEPEPLMVARLTPAGAGVAPLSPAVATRARPVRKPARRPATDRSATRARTNPAAKRKPTAKPRTTRKAGSRAKRISFARASEDALRGLGLSTTQARRVVRYRDELKLVSSVAELDVVPGIPKATLGELKSKLTD